MDMRAELEQKIRSLEEQLKQSKVMLSALNKIDALEGGPGDSRATRFLGMQPKDAIRSVLLERGKPMPKAELRKILEDGGIAIGKDRGMHNTDVSIKVSIKAKTLTMSGPQELIGLAEWAKRR